MEKPTIGLPSPKCFTPSHATPTCVQTLPAPRSRSPEAAPTPLKPEREPERDRVRIEVRQATRSARSPPSVVPVFRTTPHQRSGGDGVRGPPALTLFFSFSRLLRSVSHRLHPLRDTDYYYRLAGGNPLGVPEKTSGVGRGRPPLTPRAKTVGVIRNTAQRPLFIISYWAGSPAKP